MMGRGVFHAFCITMLLGSANALALNAGGLREVVQQYMQGQTDNLLRRSGGQGRIEFAIVGIDSRLSVPDCPQPMAFSIKEQNGLNSRINVQVACNAGNGWSLYVPVDIAIYRAVVGAANPLVRDVTLTSADVQLIDIDITQINGQYLSKIDEVVGLSVKRPLNAGTAITRDQLIQPLLIRRGDAVTITAEIDGLSVRMPGMAMTDGRRGESIRVKNSNSAKMVDAQVVEAGVVAVSM